MKTNFITFLIVLIANLVFSQTNQTVFDNKNGVTVTYSLERIGTKTNPETGFEFNKYKLTVILNNQTDKFYAVDGSLQYDGLKSGVIKNKSDDRFHHNNNDATVNHFCIEDNCSDFPSQGTAAKPHQIICPNSSQKCEKEFVHPDDLASPATVSWFGWGFREMIGNVKNGSEANKNNESRNKKVNTNTQSNFNDLWVKYFKIKQEAHDSGNWEYGKALYDYCIQKNCNEILKSENVNQLKEILKEYENIKIKYTKTNQNNK
jgi:hypothetical protein